MRLTCCDENEEVDALWYRSLRYIPAGKVSARRMPTEEPQRPQTTSTPGQLVATWVVKRKKKMAFYVQCESPWTRSAGAWWLHVPLHQGGLSRG